MRTIWGEHLKENSILPEYPRPQLKRNSFLNLNGPWAFYMGPADRKPEKLPETIPEEYRKHQELGLQLLPHRDGVEGFYMIRMRRNRPCSHMSETQ